MKRAMFIGRWQPFHSGHKWLINEKLSEGAPVLICVRDIPPDADNPFTTKQTMHMIETVYSDDDVVVMSVPDIESVNYGRDTGYDLIKHTPPKNIAAISASQIREQVEEGENEWKESVDPKIQGIVHSLLLRK